MSTITASRVLRAWMSDQLDDVLEQLADLRQLDADLSGIEESFAEHYPGVLHLAANADITSELTSQGDLLTKARAGLEAAKAVRDSVAKILATFPEDKTALRAKADAETMVDRYTRHEEAAAKVIRTLAKKQMPDALKKFSDKATKLLEAQLVDEKSVQIIPWVSKTSVYVPPANRWGQGSNLNCLLFQVVYRVQVSPSQKVELTINETTAGSKGVYVNNAYSGDISGVSDPESFLKAMRLQLRGWSGLKGEGVQTEARRKLAAAIASRLATMARQLGDYDSEQPKFTADGLHVTVAFRTGTRWEEYGDSREWESHEQSQKYKSQLNAAIDSYKDGIERASISYSEKGWWYIDVLLK